MRQPEDAAIDLAAADLHRVGQAPQDEFGLLCRIGIVHDVMSVSVTRIRLECGELAASLLACPRARQSGDVPQAARPLLPELSPAA